MISGNCVAGPRMLFSNQCLFNLLVKLRTHLMLIAHPCKFQQKKTFNGNCRGIFINNLCLFYEMYDW